MKTALLAFFFAAQSVSALASWQGIPSSDFKVTAFPELGSKASDKDFEWLHEYQEIRTQAQCRRGQRLSQPRFSTLFRSEILGPSEMEMVKSLMDKAAAFSERVAIFQKGHFDRPRPYVTDGGLKPCVQKPAGSRSYPSSHATVASAVSCLLIEVFPSKEKDLRDYARELGELRVMIGVHHPSDVLAGHKLGQEICERLKSEPDFNQELRLLRRSAGK